MKSNLYNKNKCDKVRKDLFTKKEIDSMTIEELQLSSIKYDKQKKIKQDNILTTLKETKFISNSVGIELNSNTESLNRISSELDELEYKLKISEYLVKKFLSWFSYFTPTKQFEPFVKNKTGENENTNFESANISNIDNDFYNTVELFLDELQKDSNTFNKVLKEQSVLINEIEDKTEKSNEKIKNTILKVKQS